MARHKMAWAWHEHGACVFGWCVVGMRRRREGVDGLGYLSIYPCILFVFVFRLLLLLYDFSDLPTRCEHTFFEPLVSLRRLALELPTPMPHKSKKQMTPAQRQTTLLGTRRQQTVDSRQ